VPRMSDGHLLPSVELCVVSLASMEEGGKKPCVALATESLSTVCLVTVVVGGESSSLGGRPSPCVKVLPHRLGHS
jgi:hypothetical protein